MIPRPRQIFYYTDISTTEPHARPQTLPILLLLRQPRALTTRVPPRIIDIRFAQPAVHVPS